MDYSHRYLLPLLTDLSLEKPGEVIGLIRADPQDAAVFQTDDAIRPPEVPDPSQML
jgi:hypothetical protein